MIPIVDTQGTRVGQVLVSGGYNGNEMKFVMSDGLTVNQRRNIRGRFDDAVARGRDYAEIEFTGPCLVPVKGWSNFFGIAEALSRCLPGNGLFVDWNRITWPDDKPVRGECDYVVSP